VPQLLAKGQGNRKGLPLPFAKSCGTPTFH
jgi:hypothetical protein